MINQFSGEYNWLSNFHPSIIITPWDGIKYPTVEHAFQAQKTIDLNIRRFISYLDTPKKAKIIEGRKVLLRPNWEEIKIPTMIRLCELKYIQPKFTDLLLKTDNQMLTEGNNWGDTFWGVCNGVGWNLLGYIIMNIRMTLRELKEFNHV